MQDQPLPDTALRCSAFNLMTALDAYDVASARMVDRWLDIELYADFSSQIDAIRQHGVSVPSLTVHSLQLVIAHSELVCTLWQSSSVSVSAAKLQEVMERHTLAVNVLRCAAAKMLRND